MVPQDHRHITRVGKENLRLRRIDLRGGMLAMIGMLEERENGGLGTMRIGMTSVIREEIVNVIVSGLMIRGQVIIVRRHGD